MPEFFCILCEENQGRSLLTREGAEPVELWQCKKCDLVQLHPAPTVEECVQSYEEAGHYAEETLGFEDSVLTRDRRSLDDLARSGVIGPMLDVGAGAGTMVQAAKERGWEVCAVELARSSAQNLRERHGIEVFEQPLEDLDLGDRRFGLIVLSHSLEHVARPARTLQAAARWLAPNGRVHVAVPHWDAFKRWLAGREIPWIFPGHLSYFTKDTLTAAANQAGLTPRSIRTRPFVGTDYRFAIGVLRRVGLEPTLARFLNLPEPRLDALLGDNLELQCPPWRFRAVLGGVQGLLMVLDDRIASALGHGEELRMTAVRA